jgi:hypothetical protein
VLAAVSACPAVGLEQKECKEGRSSAAAVKQGAACLAAAGRAGARNCPCRKAATAGAAQA